MKKLLAPIVLLALVYSNRVCSQTIIPAPQKVHRQENLPSLKFGHKLTIVDEQGLFKNEVEVLAPFFKQAKGIVLVYTVSKPLSEPFVELEFKKEKSTEGYELEIEASEISIEGSQTGVFYGLNSLLQLAVPTKNGVEFVPQSISDYPEFQWRGLHLDVCRHFFTANYVKKYIDLMALHKFNTFHWHLTEDQGWRIEIKKYPKLTSVGAYRNGTMVGQYRNGEVDNKNYGGFYTQDQIKEIVDYAQKRHVTVVPEIELPGHAMAAIAAYPELSCKQKPVEVAKIWGVFEEVYCAGNDSVFTFLQNVLDEVCELFPGEYIHIGGDECPKESWKACTKCQARIKSLGLKDEHELQSYFIQRIEKYLNSKGKKIIGWDEILEGGLAPNAAVMSWRGTEGAIAAANQGHKAVLTPGSHCYFDHYQGNPLWEPISIGGFTNVQKVYGFEPAPKELSGAKQKLVLGGQANLWSEYILSEKHMDYMVYPRAAAMAEALWLPTEKKNQSDFLIRLDHHLGLLRSLGVNVSYSHYQPEFVTNIEDGKPGLAMKPTTHNEFEVEFIPASDVKHHSKNITVYPDSLLQSCTAIGATYRWQFMSLPESGKVVFHTGTNLQQKDTLQLRFSKASGKKLEVRTPINQNYSKSLSTLTDGLTDDNPMYSKRWVGFDSCTAQFVIDMGANETFNKVRLSYFTDVKNRILPITGITLAVSQDGVIYDQLETGMSQTKNGIYSLNILSKKARYIRVTATTGVAPELETHILLDEVWVE